MKLFIAVTLIALACYAGWQFLPEYTKLAALDLFRRHRKNVGIILAIIIAAFGETYFIN